MRKDPLTYDGVWFVYDGECPICNMAAHALRIKQHLGELHLLNARDNPDDPLMKAINERKLDLDEGMVIYHNHHFYHGDTALQFMAKQGARSGFFNHFNKTLFWSKTLANYLYPWMRGTRNLLLKQRKIAPIDNLDKNSQPIFKAVFGKDWDTLPEVIRKHYQNRPYTHDRVTVRGVLDVKAGGPIKFLKPLLSLIGSIPPYTENQVAVTVNFNSTKDSREFQFNRIFHFKNKPPYHFKSKMVPIKNNEVMEVMRFGLCWRSSFHWENNKVILRHKGYALKVFNVFIPAPLTLLLGKGYAEEIPIDDNIFDMIVEIDHPWWKKFYCYKGRFTFINS